MRIMTVPQDLSVRKLKDGTEQEHAKYTWGFRRALDCPDT